jgi:hypothetical protein
MILSRTTCFPTVFNMAKSEGFSKSTVRGEADEEANYNNKIEIIINYTNNKVIGPQDTRDTKKRKVLAVPKSRDVEVESTCPHGSVRV